MLSASLRFAAVLLMARRMRSCNAGANASSSPMKPMRTPWPCNSSTSGSSALRNNSINAPTSSGGRCQFSDENANRVRASTPRRRQNSIAARTAFCPALWPKLRGRCRCLAQRPLPSMTMAICRGCRIVEISTLCTTASRWLGLSCMRCYGLHRHQFVFFRFHHAVDVLDELVGELLHLVFGLAFLVFGDLLVLEQFLDVMQRIAAHVAHRDLRALAFVRNMLGQFLAALLGQRRQVDPDHRAGGGRVEAEIGGDDRFFDRLHHGFFPRCDRQRAYVG